MLTYTFEKTNGVSLYEQLYRHIKSDIPVSYTHLPLPTILRV